MDAAMQRMNEILERVHHEPSNTASAIPTDNLEVEKVVTDGGSLEDAELVSEADGTRTVGQNKTVDQENQEVKSYMEGTSAEVFSDPFFVERPWISVVFTSSWGQWLFGSDEQ